jgi:hypothetical protein
VTNPLPPLSPSKINFGVALRREGSTGSGRALCTSISARKSKYQSGWEGVSSKPRQRLVSSSLSSTLSLSFETERNRKVEGSESEIVGTTLFDKKDMAMLSIITGLNLWNEEDNEASKSRTVTQKGTPTHETEPERAPLPSPTDNIKIEERVKPEFRGSQIVTTEMAAQESQFQHDTEK